MAKIGLVGARGYVGAEVLRLLARHPSMKLSLVTSSEATGKRVAELFPDVALDAVFEAPDPAAVASRELDVVVLGLSNGQSHPFVAALAERSPRTVVVDLSADHRFDAAWVYGQPERNRARIRGATRIANPGCYATAAQLALAPLAELVEGHATVFGVSGYSGAGATPSPRNDPNVLRDNVVPYSLVDHTHERELRRHLGLDVDFLPHVGPFFRGLTVTVSVRLARADSRAGLWARYEDRFGGEPMVKLRSDPPLARDVAGKHETLVGGLEVSADGKHAVVVAALDNLLAGAATQALRNANLAIGEDELTGIA